MTDSQVKLVEIGWGPVLGILPPLSPVPSREESREQYGRRLKRCCEEVNKECNVEATCAFCCNKSRPKWPRAYYLLYFRRPMELRLVRLAASKKEFKVFLKVTSRTSRNSMGPSEIQQIIGPRPLWARLVAAKSASRACWSPLRLFW